MSTPTERRFRYEAVRGTDRTRGTITAPSKELAVEALVADGWVPVMVEEAPTTAWNTDIRVLWRRLTSGSVNQVTQLVFAEQMAVMLGAGIPLVRALEIVADSERNTELAETHRKVAAAIRGGTPVPQAFAEAGLYGDLVVSYIEAGDMTGNLPEAFSQLAGALRARREVSAKVKSATTYAKVVGGIVSVVFTGLIVFVVPRLAAVYEDMDVPLPTMTVMVVSASRVAPLVLGPLVLAVGGLWLWVSRNKHIPRIGVPYDRFRFRLPIIGRLRRIQALHQWTETAHAAAAAGMRLPDAMRAAARSSGSAWVTELSEAVVARVEGGSPVSEELAQDRWRALVPPMVVGMVAAGESAGDLPGALRSAAGMLRQDIDRMTAGLGAKLENLTIAAIASLVGVVVIALYLPILTLGPNLWDSLREDQQRQQNPPAQVEEPAPAPPAGG